jgi:hypothetical protein
VSRHKGHDGLKGGQVNIFVNHENSLVPFPATRSDFTNALLSKLTLNRKTGGTLAGSFVIPNSANYQRFCSNFLVSKKQGFKHDLVLIGEEARDWVNRTGAAWPRRRSHPAPSRQAWSSPTTSSPVSTARSTGWAAGITRTLSRWRSTTSR